MLIVGPSLPSEIPPLLPRGPGGPVRNVSGTVTGDLVGPTFGAPGGPTRILLVGLDQPGPAPVEGVGIVPPPVVETAPVRPPAAPPPAPRPEPQRLPVNTTVALAPPAPKVQTEALFPQLDEFKKEVDARPVPPVVGVGAVTGLLASAGYLLLSTRASYWLLSVLTARPLFWKRFDPLEVLFAWDRKKKRRGAKGAPPDEEEESLQSLVGAK